MAGSDKPQYPQILELPAGLTVPQLHDLLNSRIQDLNRLIKGLVLNPSIVDVSLGNFRITDLADPSQDLDGVNLRTLKRFGGQTVAQQVETAGKDAYTIVSEANITVTDGSIFPAYVVGKDRTGSPSEAWVYAVGGTVTNCAVNWQVQLGGTGAFQTLLTSDLVLPAGKVGPYFASNFAFQPTMPHGTVILPVATLGGGVDLLSMGLVVKRG